MVLFIVTFVTDHSHLQRVPVLYHQNSLAALRWPPHSTSVLFSLQVFHYRSTV